MGRQLALATTRDDEAMLLQFISTLAPLRVFQSHARTQDDLWIADPLNCGVPPWTLYIWPQTFPWTPAYKQTGGPGCPPESVGLSYISNASVAPVLELSRSDLSQQRHGRLYWGRNFSAPHGLAYDAEAFARFVDAVWRYVRKVSKHPKGSRYASYYFPEAAKTVASENG